MNKPVWKLEIIFFFVDAVRRRRRATSLLHVCSWCSLHCCFIMCCRLHQSRRTTSPNKGEALYLHSYYIALLYIIQVFTYLILQFKGAWHSEPHCFLLTFCFALVWSGYFSHANPGKCNKSFTDALALTLIWNLTCLYDPRPQGQNLCKSPEETGD